jgi:CheY-like chemotaxis protein
MAKWLDELADHERKRILNRLTAGAFSKFSVVKIEQICKFRQWTMPPSEIPPMDNATIGMPTHTTILCIHPDPAQLSLLQDNGYSLLTATNGGDGLQFLLSRPVAAVVLDYQLGVSDGRVIADQIKQIRPTVPIVMLTDSLELPDGALKSVDVFAAKSDGTHFLLAKPHHKRRVSGRKMQFK